MRFKQLRESRGTYRPIDGAEPILVGHINLKYDVKVALVVRVLVDGHALAAQDDGTPGLDGLPQWARYMDATAV